MNTKRNDLFRLFVSLGIVLLASYLLSFFFFKADLTEEKRHTLTPATRDMLGEMEDKVFVRCYLHGEFPAGFKRLEQSIRERLQEFRDYSDGLVDYEFIDIYSEGDKKTIGEKEQALFEKGLRFTRLTFENNGATSSQLIWPAAILEYQGKEYAVQFYKSDMPEPTDEMINSSVNNLEFELASNFRKALRKDKPAVAVLEGHRELKDIQMADYLLALEENYDIDFVQIDDRINALSDKLPNTTSRTNKYDALIIAKPDSLFSFQDRVVIDQFVMNGGKVLWMVDPVLTDLDSLAAQQQTMAISNEMGLYDLVYAYGARMNRNLVIDFQGAPIAFDAGPQGNQRQIQMFTWYYAPLLFPPADPHPIVANLDPIKFDFASSIDTVNQNPDVKKIPLLFSSPLSKELKTPVRVNTAIVELGQDYFTQNPTPNRIMALLMEGQFPAAVQEGLKQEFKTSPDIAWRDKSVPTKMIVIADGDVVRNQIMPTPEGPVPQALGYDRYARRVIYDNKEFLLNCMNYLLDDQALISVRSRTIKLRKLDTAEVNLNRSAIQIRTVVLPILVVLGLGVVQFVLRKRKWSAVAPPKK
ncbi:MAG: gliding motility-associated ABC transporter substrate-binding protein GldG [Flavobacteriales bacterium]|jgi:gliding-associated putative ABC transporter substrate-binding component GldG